MVQIGPWGRFVITFLRTKFRISRTDVCFEDAHVGGTSLLMLHAQWLQVFLR
jgi:hypothetical protein